MSKRYSIVGTQFTGTPESVIQALQNGEPLDLVREPDNPVDGRAIAVFAGSLKIGYIAKKQNDLAERIDASPRELALDANLPDPPKRFIGKFVRSRSSGFPMVEVPE